MRIALKYLFVFACLLGGTKIFAQGIGDVEVINSANYDPVIKEAAKQTDKPEIVDTVKRITNISYSTPAKQYATTYSVNPIEPAKMVNEPLSKLYSTLIKLGVGNYTMPYGEIFYNNLRSKDINWGLRYKHLSSHAKFTNMGTTDFSDNEAGIYVKKFLRKHTLSGDFNYSRNVVHYYGFSDTVFKNLDANTYKQRFQLFEAKGRLQSHYADSAGNINHDIRLNYYNLGDNYKTFENNVFANGLINLYAGRANVKTGASVDYYNVMSANDTLNNVITRLHGLFEEGSGAKWKMSAGIGVAIDYFDFRSTKYYFYPQFNAYYNIYNNIVIPYAGISGGLDKNSFRSLSSVNPFVLSELEYKNTNNHHAFAGLRGSLSSNTSYDVKALYGQYDNMPFFLAEYERFPENPLGNRYKVLYMNTRYLNINGQIKYQFREKINISAKGNFYNYKLDTSGVYPWHKPNFDITFSGNYNLKSKIIIKADVFVIGKQWALQKSYDNTGVPVYKAAQLNGITDINLGVEYRYTKMLSAFVSFNNIGSFRYYRWDLYPTQKFNAMIGLTFVPF